MASKPLNTRAQTTVISISLVYGVAAPLLPALLPGSHSGAQFFCAAILPAVWLVFNALMLMFYGKGVLPAFWMAPFVFFWPCVFAIMATSPL